MPGSVNRTESARGFPGSSFKYTPLRHIRVLFVSFVQGLFAAAPPNSYHWSPDENTEIVVRDENPIHVNNYGERPCVNFTVGRCQFYSVGMDDLHDYDFRTDAKKKGVLVPGTMTINVSSRSDIEAHDLAWVIGEHVWLLRDLFMKKGFFELGRGIDVSPPGPPGSVIPADQADGWYVAPVSVPWQFARTSVFTPLGRRIVNSIETNFELADGRYFESIGWPSSVYNRNNVNRQESFPDSYAPGATDTYGRTPDPAAVRAHQLTKVPHPLNPAKLVTVREIYPFRARNRTLRLAL